MLGVSDAVVILFLNLISVFLVVRRHRFSWERRLRTIYGFDRHWWVPLIALGVALSFSVVGFSAVRTAFLQKSGVIALIFSFGVMAEGLRTSGFFKYLAYRIVEKGKGETSRLILYMFVLTSAVTFFTSNDIVVYVLTPIIVTICFQAGIRNTKLILLSQFIAANTLSMGMLIGSPTNLIIAESTGLDFFSYLFLMFLPAFVAFSASLLLLKSMTAFLDKDRFSFFSDLRFDGGYSVPEENPEPVFTSQMRDWVAIFGVFVALVALVTFLDYSLFLCAVPAIFISLSYWHFSGKHENAIRKPMENLPYGIFFFGMTFFIFAEQFSRTGFVNTELAPLLKGFFEGSKAATVFTGIFGSGIMVNMFLDLPSSAIIGQVLPKLELGFLTKKILTQATLVGLNIGTYVTSVGALAGLIWFEEMRLQRNIKEKEFPDLKEEMVFPDRIDLIRYGSVSFVFTGLIAGLFLLVEFLILSGLGF